MNMQHGMVGGDECGRGRRGWPGRGEERKKRPRERQARPEGGRAGALDLLPYMVFVRHVPCQPDSGRPIHPRGFCSSARGTLSPLAPYSSRLGSLGSPS